MIHVIDPLSGGMNPWKKDPEWKNQFKFKKTIIYRYNFLDN